MRPEQIAAAIAAGELSLGYLDYVMQPPPVIDRTYSDVAEDLAIAFDVVERLFLAFGLPQPVPHERAREDDTQILHGLKALLGAIDEADVPRSLASREFDYLPLRPPSRIGRGSVARFGYEPVCMSAVVIPAGSAGSREVHKSSALANRRRTIRPGLLPSRQTGRR